MVGVVDRGVHNSVVSNSMVGSVVGNWGSMVHSVVGNRGSVMDSVVGNWGSMVDSVVGHRSGVNCMSHRGGVDGAAGKGCEGNLGLRGSQDGGEKGSNGKCPHGVALLED